MANKIFSYVATALVAGALGVYGGYKYASRTSVVQKNNEPRIYAAAVDFDGNSIDDLFSEDPERKTIRILWGDYIKLSQPTNQPRLQSPRTSYIPNTAERTGLARFTGQGEGHLVPISRNYQQSPEVVETTQPRDIPQEQDCSKMPAFEPKPQSNIAYFDTTAMIARHPDRRTDYSHIESQVKAKYEKMINDPCVKND